MYNETFVVEIEGEEVTDLLYKDLISLEVELDDELAAMFRMRIALAQQADGTWSYLDDERFAVWNTVTINAGFEGSVDLLMSGYITHVRPLFEDDPSQCVLEVWGMDGSVLMDRQEKRKDWPDKKDSDIAREILNQYGFTPEVEDTEIVHDQKLSTIIQRETDMQFLRRLALRNGFECYVEGDTGYFRSPQADAEPQPVLEAHFGEETNLVRFSVEINGLTSANVAMHQVDRLNKKTLEAITETSQQTALGETDAAGLFPPGFEAGQVFAGDNVVTGLPEMTALCQGLFHQGQWFVTGEGEIAANHYGYVLSPRLPVTIKGVGETHSGMYWVSHVTHKFMPDGYFQYFRVRRNGIGLTGSEDFSRSADQLSGLL